MSFSDKQIESLRDYYPNSNYDELFKVFPNKTKQQIGAIARKYGIKSNNPGHRKDLTGKEYYDLYVIEMAYVDDRHKVHWKCRCKCGKEKIVEGSLLVNGSVKSCGCRKSRSTIETFRKDYTGQRFGKLVAIQRFPHYKGNRTYYLCQCDCGSNPKMISSSNLVGGHTCTCGKCEVSRNAEFWHMKKGDYEDPDLYCVYMHVAPNGKRYIGITKQNVERRWQNGHGYDTQRLFSRAIQHYGWDKFDHEVLEINLSVTEAYKREKFYIKKYNTLDSKFGYNVHQGGTSGRTLVTPVIQYHFGKPVNYFESLLIAAKELGVSDSTIGNYCKREDMPDGYSFKKMEPIHRYEIDKKYLELRNKEHYCVVDLVQKELKEKTVDRNKKTCRKINQYDLMGRYIKTWNSIKEAENELGIQNISSVCSKKKKSCKTAGDYQWRYYEGEMCDIEPVEINKRFRAVLQIDDKMNVIKRFDSIADAARTVGTGITNIQKVCCYTNQKAKGFIWRYADDPDAFKPLEMAEQHYYMKPINQYSLDGKYIKTFESAAEASRELKKSMDTISSVAYNDSVGKSLHGFMWRFDNGDHSDIEPIKNDCMKAVRQIDLETKEIVCVFESAREAERITGIKAANISKVCKGKRKSAGNSFWEFVN